MVQISRAFLYRPVDYLKGQVDLALYENMMTTLGLASHAKSQSPLRLLSSDVMDQVYEYAAFDKPKTKGVKAAAKARANGSLAIVPFEGWQGKSKKGKKNASKEDEMNMADLGFFTPGRKIVFPLTLPSLHLTGPCYRGKWRIEST